MKTWKRFPLRELARIYDFPTNDIQNDFELRYKKDLTTDYECEYLVFYQNENNIEGYKNRFLYHYGEYEDGEPSLPNEVKPRYEQVRKNSTDNFLRLFNNNSEQRGDKMPTIEELRIQLAEAENKARNSDTTAWQSEEET
jgi:hypothetical protein